MRRYLDLGLTVAAIAIIIAAMYNIPRSKAQSTQIGPNATSVALSTTSAQILGQNPSRHALQICNPTAIVEFIAPAPIVPLTAGGVGIGLPAIASGVTSCFTAPLGVSIGSAWNAVSASSTPNITVLEYP
jgi:hypothetical protein